MTPRLASLICFSCFFCLGLRPHHSNIAVVPVHFCMQIGVPIPACVRVCEQVLRPMQYHGTPGERAALRSGAAAHDVVVMSYEALRAGGKRDEQLWAVQKAV
jgi:hypothetical protein